MNGLQGTLAVGHDVVDFVKPYFELFKDDGFALALSLALLVLAAAFAVIFLFAYVLPIRWTLWGKTLVVRRTRDYEGFARELHTVDKEMTKSRLLRHAWQEFRETLIEPNSARRTQYFSSPQIFQNRGGEASLSLFPSAPELLRGRRSSPNVLRPGLGALLRDPGYRRGNRF
jgi:hypothetical protein